MSLTKILLREFQSKNYLYHFTSVDSASRIVDSNKLKASSSLATNELLKSKVANWGEFEKKLQNNETIKGVSFTRNRRLPQVGKAFIGGTFGRLAIVGFVFDRNKLKSNYKLIPFDAHHNFKPEDKRVLDEEIIIGDVKNIRSLTEFIYINRKYARETDMYEEYIRELMKFYKTYKDYFPFKVFRKGNFKEIDVDVSNWDGNLDFNRGSAELQMYREIFPE